MQKNCEDDEFYMTQGAQAWNTYSQGRYHASIAEYQDLAHGQRWVLVIICCIGSRSLRHDRDTLGLCYVCIGL